MAFATGPIPIQGLSRDNSYNPSVVALGGGHGLSASLSALRRLTTSLTAVVTVADDGGSSGRLRESFPVLPPGDLRMALAALCDDNDWGRTWRDVMQHRFEAKTNETEPLNGHAVGNLLILALWELLEDPVAGLRWAGALLGARGQVLPMSTVPLTIHGEVLQAGQDGNLVRGRIDGQADLAAAGNNALVTNVNLEPEGAPACIEALEAIDLAGSGLLVHLGAAAPAAARNAFGDRLDDGQEAADHEPVHEHRRDRRDGWHRAPGGDCPLRAGGEVRRHYRRRIQGGEPGAL